MKVLYLTNVPAPYRVRFFNELSKHCELTVLYECKSSLERNENWVGYANDGYEIVFLTGLRTRTDAGFCPGIIKYLRRKKYDIIVVGGYSTPTAMLFIIALRLCKIPYVLNADGGFALENEPLVKKRIKSFFISGASFWLSSGQMTSKYLKSYGADPKKTYIYPFSSVMHADVLIKPVPKEQKLLLRKQKGINCETLVLSVGQFIPRKGFLEFLKVWTSEPKDGWGLAIIGGGAEEALYKNIAKENENLWILPFLKSEDLADYYKAADAFVLPTNEDIWGLVINEAMAYGLPIFSTDRCIAAETMQGEGVSLFPVGDNAAIIDSLMALNRASDGFSLSESVLEKSRDYTIEKMAERHIEVFKEIWRKR